MPSYVKCFVMAACFAMSTGFAQADVIKLNGATTTVDRLINPHKAAVEAKTGNKLEITGNATGKGLVDLVEGRCDASLCSEPLGIAAVAAKAAGRDVEIKSLTFTVLKTDEIVFVVNADNPVDALTWGQIKAIHTGKIKNWKEVGGKDAPIKVYTDTPTGGTRAMIKQIVLSGEEYADTVAPQTAVKVVGEKVAADPNGIGGLGKGFASSAKTKIIKSNQVLRPLGIITVGEPKGKVLEVINVLKGEVAKEKG